MACAINFGKELLYGSVAIKMSIKFDNIIFGTLFQFWKFILRKLCKIWKKLCESEMFMAVLFMVP